MIKAFYITKYEPAAQHFKKMLEREGIQIVSICLASGSALEQYKEVQADLILTDANWEGNNQSLSGEQLIRQLLAYNPEANIVVITKEFSKKTMIEMKKLGAKGYFYRLSNLEEIIQCIKSVAEGKTHFPKQ